VQWEPPDDPERVTVLVTGGHGFIGTHLARFLARRRFRVVVVDKLGGPRRGRWDGSADSNRVDSTRADSGRAGLTRVESMRLDIADFDQCKEAVRAIRPQVVFHLAASSTIDSAFSDPYGSLLSNVGGTMNMLEAVRINCPDLARFVLSSTDKVYGELIGDSYTEGSSLWAQGVYDVGKLSADTLVQLFGYELDMPVSILRLCNVFGPGDVNTKSRVVPRSLGRLFDSGQPRPPLIYRSSMAHSRDYVYVADAVRALAMIAFSPKASGEVFNMAPAAHRTTLDLVKELIVRSTQACEFVDRERAEVIRRNGYQVVSEGSGVSALERQHCDASKLMSVLDFRPLVSMSDGLDRTIRWFMRDHGIGVTT
jgi:nucleoside-diphosphate-sugar epimerase